MQGKKLNNKEKKEQISKLTVKYVKSSGRVN